MKILINTTSVSIPAGVSNHFLGLKTYFSKDVVYNQYWTGGYIRSKVRFKVFQKPLRLMLMFIDLIKFVFLILRYDRPIILLNPSFGRTALKRDALFLNIAKLFSCKTAVFFHGWDKDFFYNVLEDKKLFNSVWYKADAFFVLANEFRAYLRQLNIQSPIYTTTTKVDDRLVENVLRKEISSISTILFLARVERSKGIFTTIDSFEILSRKHPQIELRVVGGGKALEQAKEYVEKKNLNNVYFTGPLVGDELRDEFCNADLYILPTHGEGMPTSVLEAMAFGLPVITRPVGGLVDFFENDNMGYLVESLDPIDYVERIESLIDDIDKTNRISAYNIHYAREHFMASKVGNQLENSLLEIGSSTSST